MTGGNHPERDALDRLADALVEDILDMSDQEILAECRNEGIDPAAEAKALRALFEKSLIKANKHRLLAAKAGVVSSRRGDSAFALRAPVDIAEARRRLHAAIENPGVRRNLTLAARKESELSDDDIISMVGDLEELGIIPPANKPNEKS